MGFEGWPSEALAFYAGLEKDNTREYWQAHRDVYEDAVREPLELLVEEALEEFGPGKVFRPYRDVRFSKDKAPYKTVAAAYVVPPDLIGGFYVQLSSERLRVGGGLYEPSRDQLARQREAIDRDGPGGRLEAVLADLRSAGFDVYGAELRTAPRGYPRDHPRIEHLRRTRLAVLRDHEPAEGVHDARARDLVFGGWRAVRPLLEWLSEHVGPAHERRKRAGER